ncbi:MAG: four helix bundle protein [Bacteroidetes bacterium]|nr:four helix bundle protein [Bacteroidota bacterium]MBU1579396.1 four helix bundle protein [Bacteroidota bacterium]MBU2465784.1 four helix bundle protein [Bacteroidota bacterium]MBU2558497.1 four helix bundle protein [Bacteroidota bacterium]
MGIYENLPVFKASYDLLLNIYQFTGKFTREYKYTLGEKIKNETLLLLVLVYRANSSKNKVEILQNAHEQIELIRLMIRLVKDLKQISLNSFIRINQQVENVSKQLTGWQKSQK